MSADGEMLAGREISTTRRIPSEFNWQCTTRSIVATIVEATKTSDTPPAS
jgi:hypothetical protein